MDVAYDHIQEESFPDDERRKEEGSTGTAQPPNTFNSEVQDAYKAISSSPWAARIGGFFGSVKKQGESYYEGARQEYSPAISQATSQATNTLSGLRSSLLDRTRNLSISQTAEGEAGPSTAAGAKRTITDKEGNTIEVAAPASTDENAALTDAERADSLPADIVKEAESMLSRLRFEGAKRLKDIQKAEDAADEALLKFGTNVANFLREAVTIAPPDENDGAAAGGAAGAPGTKVLFESKDASGKRVIHTTRLDAQLHVIHSSVESFEKDPESPEWEGWSAGFDVNKKTDDISRDLEKYGELRQVMERLVPEKVAYQDFWRRYYFLRHVVESEDHRRREMLKASTTTATEEISWDDDDSDDDDNAAPSTSTTNLAASKETLKPASQPAELPSSSSTTPSTQPQTATPSAQTQTPTQTQTQTQTQTSPSPTQTQTHLKPSEPRRSHDEKSVTGDSDASYDVVSGASGATSRGQGSPVVHPAAGTGKKEGGEKGEEESDDDWE